MTTTFQKQAIPESHGGGNEYIILINGERAGSIERGWLRGGGEQWVVTAKACGFPVQTGFPSLKEAKRIVLHRLAKLEQAA